jgi:hypothetical protein
MTVDLEARIAELAENASAGCGLVYELYVERFSGAVDRFVATLPEDQRARAIEIATTHDYASPDEIAEGRDSVHADGLCRHYLPFDCCPLGCGEGD